VAESADSNQETSTTDFQRSLKQKHEEALIECDRLIQRFKYIADKDKRRFTLLKQFSISLIPIQYKAAPDVGCVQRSGTHQTLSRGAFLYRTERSKSVISTFFDLLMLRVFPPINRLYESGIRQQVEAGNEGKIMSIDTVCVD
jgi:hypothetical protein